MNQPESATASRAAAQVPQPAQVQQPPGSEEQMRPLPDFGGQSYQGRGRLADKKAVITGADSGIGRAVAVAFAREGADVMIAYLDEHDDAQATAQHVEQAGRKAVLYSGDLADPARCQELVGVAVTELGGIDILVNNAAFQMSHSSIEEISDEEWDRTFAVNIGAVFRVCRAALAHLRPGASIINTASVVSDQPKPTLLPYSATKAAVAAFSAGLAQQLGERGIRVNSVAPGPIWTPLIPSSMPPEQVRQFGTETPLGRPGQPAEVAPAFVLLASDEASYISGAMIAVTGGRPVL